MPNDKRPFQMQKQLRTNLREGEAKLPCDVFPHAKFVSSTANCRHRGELVPKAEIL